MKALKQPKIDEVLQSQTVKNLTVYRHSDREWYFTFDAIDDDSGEWQSFTMETQRGKLRTWADPRILFAYLSDRGISSGMFELHKGNGNDESTDSLLQEEGSSSPG